MTSPKTNRSADATPSSGAPLLQPFGRYTLLRKIARGGMATLYLARLDGPIGFEKYFAIKRIHPHLAEESEFVSMFLDEARIASRIQHPNVVQIFELGEQEDELFFAMEYLQGENLADVMKSIALDGGQPSLAQMAYIIARTATGLHAAHELRGHDGETLGLVHRDVSPHNVFITYDGAVKLLDFGIAKATGRLSKTATGELKGKYAYMAPEQLLGSHHLDRRADIFSLGIILYEATTLRRLFKGDNEAQTIDRVSRCQVTPPREFRPEYPATLESIVMRALQKSPDARYQNAAELAADLDEFIANSESRASAATLASWMTERFAAMAREKRKFLDSAATAIAPSTTAQSSETNLKSSLLAGAAAFFVAALLTVVSLLSIAGDPPDPATGTVTIRSSPVNAVVALDGEASLGRTPLQIAGIGIGRHELALSAPGFQSRRTSFDLEQPNQLVTVLVPLERNRAQVGLLQIEEAEGVTVSIDGYGERLETPLELELEPGRHRLRIHGPQGQRSEHQLTIHAEKTTLFTPPLPRATQEPGHEPVKQVGDSPRSNDRHNRQQRIKAAKINAHQRAESGYLNLNSAPWAEVYLGGRKLGTTPLVKAKLPAGRQRLKLLLEGTPPPRFITVEISPNSTSRRTVSY